MHVEFLAQGVVPRRGRGPGRSPGSVAKGDLAPHLQAKAGAGCPLAPSLHWVSALGSSPLGEGGLLVWFFKAIPSCSNCS